VSPWRYRWGEARADGSKSMSCASARPHERRDGGAHPSPSRASRLRACLSDLARRVEEPRLHHFLSRIGYQQFGQPGDTIKASYLGDSTYSGSGGNTSETVNKATTTLTLAQASPAGAPVTGQSDVHGHVGDETTRCKYPNGNRGVHQWCVDELLCHLCVGGLDGDLHGDRRRHDHHLDHGSPTGSALPPTPKGRGWCWERNDVRRLKLLCGRTTLSAAGSATCSVPADTFLASSSPIAITATNWGARPPLRCTRAAAPH
jgi:hypothetical protein